MLRLLQRFAGGRLNIPPFSQLQQKLSTFLPGIIRLVVAQRLFAITSSSIATVKGSLIQHIGLLYQLQRMRMWMALLLVALSGLNYKAVAGDDAPPGTVPFRVTYGSGLKNDCDLSCEWGVVSIVPSVESVDYAGSPSYHSYLTITVALTYWQVWGAHWNSIPPENVPCGEGSTAAYALSIYEMSRGGSCSGATGATRTRKVFLDSGVIDGGWREEQDAWDFANASVDSYFCVEESVDTFIGPGTAVALLEENTGLDLSGVTGSPVPPEDCGGAVLSGLGFNIAPEAGPCHEMFCGDGSPFDFLEYCEVYVCCSCLPPPGGCPSPKIWDETSCTCVCPPTTCPPGEVLNETTCECEETTGTPGDPDGDGPGDPPPPPPPPPGDPGTGGPDPDPGDGDGDDDGPGTPDPDDPGPGDPPPPDPDPDDPDGDGPTHGGPDDPSPCVPRECDPGYHWSVQHCACLPDADPPGEGSEGIIGFCGDATGTCSTDWGFKSVGGGWVSFRAWVRNTKAGSLGSSVGHTQIHHWQVLQIELPWDMVQHWCCWQQTWSINLPESSVDMTLVNSWANRYPQSDRLNANLIKLRNVITQATSIQFEATGWGGDAYGAPEQPYQGYACGVFLYPGPGCQYEETTSTAVMEKLVLSLGPAVEDMYSTSTQKAGEITQGFLAEFNTMMGSVTTSITLGLVKPANDAITAFEAQLEVAKQAAGDKEDGFFTWTYGKALFGGGEGNSVDLLHEVSTAFGTVIPASVVTVIRALGTIFIYLVGLRAVWGMVVPATVLPGSGLGSRGDDDD